jgi:transposase
MALSAGSHHQLIGVSFQDGCNLLFKLDENYPQHWKIRLTLDNHSAHVSKEAQKYLKGKPDRFGFVFTPKHGSLLNLIEVFFSKLS